MKVLLIPNYTTFQTTTGGVKERVLNYYNYVNKQQNVSLDIFNLIDTRVEDYDVVHFVKIQQEHFNIFNLSKKLNKRIIISPVIPTNNVIINKFKYILTILFKLEFHPRYRVGYMLKNCSLVLPQTNKESDAIKTMFLVNKEKLIVLPNGVDVSESKDDYSREFKMKGNKIILVIGRFDENKNQLRVIKALKHSSYNLVFVGGSDGHHQEYYEKCINNAGKNTIFTGWLEKTDPKFQWLKQNSDVILLPSINEIFGNSIYETSLYGARIVTGCNLELVKIPEELVVRINPLSLESIRNGVDKAILMGKSDACKKIISTNFNWDKITRSLTKKYNFE